MPQFDADFDVPENEVQKLILESTKRVLDAIFLLSFNDAAIALSIAASVFASVIENCDEKGREEGLKLLKEFYESTSQRYQ